MEARLKYQNGGRSVADSRSIREVVAIKIHAAIILIKNINSVWDTQFAFTADLNGSNPILMYLVIYISNLIF